MTELVRVDDELVAKVHECLAEALRRTRIDPFTAPVTVAEIYQDLVPYRRIRSVVGFQMNADYEHTLLRLLSGEGGYARLEPSEAREELQAELESPNPNVGLFRKYAACDVWITPAELPPLPEESGEVESAAATPATNDSEAVRPRAKSAARAAPPEPAGPASHDANESKASAVPLGAPSEELAAAVGEEPPELLLEDEVESEPEAELAPVTAEHTPPTGASNMPESKSQGSVATAAVGTCVFCSSGLPDGRLIRFCPFCGADQSLRPCSACAEPLEAGWRFCIACGVVQE